MTQPFDRLKAADEADGVKAAEARWQALIDAGAPREERWQATVELARLKGAHLRREVQTDADSSK